MEDSGGSLRPNPGRLWRDDRQVVPRNDAGLSTHLDYAQPYYRATYNNNLFLMGILLDTALTCEVLWVPFDSCSDGYTL